MTISSGFFFSFFQNFHFRVVRGVKGQKIDQNDKKISVALHISETIHHMIVIYGVVSGVKGQKMDQNDKKNLSVSLRISGTVHQMIVIFGTYV